MDQHARWVHEKRITRVLDALKKNNMNGYFVKDMGELHKLLSTLIEDGQTVSFGGSMTLFETNTLDYLRNREISLLDRYAEGLTGDDIKQLYRDSFSADAYITSTNAITEDGALYNVDGNGNRVAAMVWGPDRVIVISGTNKVVKDEQEAIRRNREVAAPANTRRLDRKTPCAELGYCTDCSSPDRICSAYVTIRKQVRPDRMHVILVDGNYGY